MEETPKKPWWRTSWDVPCLGRAAERRAAKMAYYETKPAQRKYGLICTLVSVFGLIWAAAARLPWGPEGNPELSAGQAATLAAFFGCFLLAGLYTLRQGWRR